MSGTGSTEASSATASILKRKSNDVGWEYGMLIDPKNMDKVKCKLCSKVMSGGVYRVKEHIGHISGNVSACPKASPDDRAKCKNAIEEARNKKKNKKKEEDLMRSTVNISEKGEGDGDDELPKYTCKEGVFGKSWAIQGCATNDDNYNPVKWWMTYGNQTPNLQRMARRILSLTSSSSGCERNWSTFEGIHTKKRNRLDVNRLNNLVFVQFNAKLMNKQKRENERNVDVLLATDASNAQGWIVDGEDDEEIEPGMGLTWEMVGEASGADDMLQPRRSSRMRELHEDDFQSEEEDEQEHHEFDFESDEDRVLEEYGEEEEEI